MNPPNETTGERPVKAYAMPMNPKIAPGAQPASMPRSMPTQAKRWHPSIEEEPAYIRNDPGLACLTSQLGRINAQIMCHDYFKRSVADAEEECKRDLAASLAKSLVSSSSIGDGRNGREYQTSQPNYLNAPSMNQWIKKWDPEVGAEYFFNIQTGEASWLDPHRYGMM
ncbi:hypothetical protein ACHAXR_007817 [Thalassiosira sp. AJA248-18]